MPRHFIAQIKYGNLKPWVNCIDDNPPNDDPSGAGGGASLEDLKAQLSQLQQEVQAKDGIISKLRPIERKWNTVAGGLSDERLQELKIADQRLAELQQQQEQSNLKIRQEVASEYDPKIQKLTSEKEALQGQLGSVEMTFDLFKDFNANGGVGSRFQSFVQLTDGNWERNQDGQIQIRDDSGNLVLYKNPDAKPGEPSERVATPSDFLKMLNSGQIAKSSYNFSQLEMLMFTLEAYNKASGSGLPPNNGYDMTKPFSEMTKSELDKAAFG